MQTFYNFFYIFFAELNARGNLRPAEGIGGGRGKLFRTTRIPPPRKEPLGTLGIMLNALITRSSPCIATAYNTHHNSLLPVCMHSIRGHWTLDTGCMGIMTTL